VHAAGDPRITLAAAILLAGGGRAALMFRREKPAGETVIEHIGRDNPHQEAVGRANTSNSLVHGGGRIEIPGEASHDIADTISVPTAPLTAWARRPRHSRVVKMAVS